MQNAFRLIAAAIGWFALALQYWLVMTGDIGPEPVGRTITHVALAAMPGGWMLAVGVANGDAGSVEVRALGADQQPAGGIDGTEQVRSARELGPASVARPEHATVGADHGVAEDTRRSGDRHAARQLDQALRGPDAEPAHDRSPARASVQRDGSPRYGALNAIRSTRSP